MDAVVEALVAKGLLLGGWHNRLSNAVDPVGLWIASISPLL